VLGAPTHPEGPHGVGGALVVAGLLLLGLSLHEPSPGGSRGSVGTLLLVALPLVVAAILLPAVLWRGVYGVTLLTVVVWLAPRVRAEASRQLFNVGITLLALAGIGLMAGAARPSLGVVSGGVVAVLMLGGMVGLAAASVFGEVAAEVGSLRHRLGDLEDDHEHLLRLTELDPLTGCPTRRALRAWFERWQGGQPVSVALLDIDNLKRINERQGHAAGDEALRLMAGVLTSSIRPGDLVVRWGGDEFVVVLRGADRDAATRRLTSLMSTLQESTEKFPYEERLRFDWGVSTCSAPADISGALAEADERMFAMKRRRSE
jgi:diguanylate cyclase (GGDEF)-like protein